MRRHGLVLAVSAASVLVLWSPPAAANPGDLDPTFGSGGIARHAVFWGLRSTALLPDGRIVASVSGGAYGVARFTASGALDTTFGDGGASWAPVEEGMSGELALQADGRILVAGYAEHAGRHDLAVTRFLPGGQVDTGFSGDGVAWVRAGFESFADDVLIRPDGRIVLVGDGVRVREEEGSTIWIQLLAVAQFLPDGGLDPSFGGDGVVRIRMAVGPTALAGVRGAALRPDGRLLVAGGAGTFEPWVQHVAFVQLLPDGRLDRSFGTGGRSSPPGPAGPGVDVVLLPDGRAVAAVSAGAAGRFAAVRILPSGELDPTFDDDGWVRTRFGIGASAIALDGDRVLLLGSAPTPSGRLGFGLLRVKTDGRQSLSFGDRGTVVTDLGADGFGEDVVVSPGRVKALGVGTCNGACLVRYLLR